MVVERMDKFRLLDWEKDPALQCPGVITKGRTRWDQEMNTFVSGYPVSFSAKRPRWLTPIHEDNFYHEDIKTKGKWDENIK